MLKNKYPIVLSCLFFSFYTSMAQNTEGGTLATPTLSLEEVLTTIEKNNPQLKMYDADIKSMDIAALGAKSWMPPQVSSGFFMTPYNVRMWRANDRNSGMGSFMVGVTQMIPNPKRLSSEFNYMNAMSSVEFEKKNYTLNQLRAMAKSNYYQWLVLQKKVKITNENLILLGYMIQSMEIRYQYNMMKLPTYYKAKSQYSALQNMIVMLENDISQKRITLNTLMTNDKNRVFEIDSTYHLLNFDTVFSDTTSRLNERSDIRAIENTIALNRLKIEVEKVKLLPEFGIRYDHMFPFGQNPMQFNIMVMANIPMPWSTQMNLSNIGSIQLKNKSLYWQKEMILNEASGMISSMNTELQKLKKQYNIVEKSIIPALKKNYETALLAWQNNTGELFEVLDAWEALNMAQIEALDKLQNMLNTQVEIEKQLEIK
ncbi:MAG: TolC family protein [Saprospiraceae bacterium]|nr:TolC family protein [Saprospiraceae bacterium]